MSHPLLSLIATLVENIDDEDDGLRLSTYGVVETVLSFLFRFSDASSSMTLTVFECLSTMLDSHRYLPGLIDKMMNFRND